MKWETTINETKNKYGVNMSNNNGLLDIIFAITGILFIIVLIQAIKDRKEQKALKNIQEEEIIKDQEEIIFNNDNEEEIIYVFKE